MIFQDKAELIYPALWAVIIVTTFFFVLVIVTKSRRDVREKNAQIFKSRFVDAVRSGNTPAVQDLLEPLAQGSASSQADLVMLLASISSQPWWNDKYFDLIRQASNDSGLYYRLLEQLTSTNAVRRGTAVVLGGFPSLRMDAEDVSYLLNDPEPTVRYATVATLEAIANEEAAKALISALIQSCVPEGRVIERLNHPWATDALISTLMSNEVEVDERVRCGLIRALPATGNTRVITLLLDLMVTGTDEERIQAMRKLAASVPQCNEQSAEHIMEAARESLDSVAPQVRAAGICALAAGAKNSDIALIGSYLSDPDWFVRRESAQALASFGLKGIKALEKIAAGKDLFAADRAREQLEMLRVDLTQSPVNK
jgi:HEAT repeat protein